MAGVMKRGGGREMSREQINAQAMRLGKPIERMGKQRAKVVVGKRWRLKDSSVR